MRIFSGLILSAALLGAVALAPAAKADGFIPGHYEVRMVQQTDEGRWVNEERTVTSPGHWEDFTREEVVVAGHYETRCQTVSVPVMVRVPRYVQDCNGVQTVYETVCQTRTETREVQVWIPAQTRCVQDRRWIPGETRTVCVPVFQPGCTREVATQVWIPARYDGCAPQYPQHEERRGDRIEAGFTIGGGRSRVRIGFGFGR